MILLKILLFLPSLVEYHWYFLQNKSVQCVWKAICEADAFLPFLFLFCFCMLHAACRILVPTPGMEPVPPAVEAQSPNHWTGREVGASPFLDKLIRCHREFLGNLSRPVPFQMLLLILQFIQSLSGIWLFANPWAASRQVSLSLTNSRSFLKLLSIESVMPSNHLIFCLPLHLLPSVFPSIRVFSNESVLHIRRPKYQSFSFSIRPSSECSRLISFRMDWFELLAVQGTLQSLLHMYSVNIHPGPWGFPGAASGREPTCQCSRCKRCGFDHCAGEIPWSRRC